MCEHSEATPMNKGEMGHGGMGQGDEVLSRDISICALCRRAELTRQS